MKFEIVTPHGVIFSETIQSVTAPGAAGQFQVLDKHADMIAELGVGALTVVYDNYTDYFTCNQGVLEVRNHEIVVLTESSENYKDIDVARAEAAVERAKRRIEKRKPNINFDRAQIALTRALNRLKLSRFN